MSIETTTLAKGELLERGEVTATHLNKLMGKLMSHRVDRGELYFQNTRQEVWSLDDGLVKNASFAVDRGVGARAISGEKTGFAYADEIRPAALEQATDAARSIAKRGMDQTIAVRKELDVPELYSREDPIRSVDQDKKVALLSKIDRFTRALDHRVKEVNVALSASHDITYVYNSDGSGAGDVRPLVVFRISVIVEQNGRRETGSAGGGGRHDLSWLFSTSAAEDYAREAVRIALVNLEAVDAPAGPMNVILGPGWPGILLHEAVGHGLEGDFNRKGTSTFSNRVGDLVASPLCTVIDDATIPNRRGSLTVDDEGTPGQRTVLIENGILRGYLQDRMNAELMGTASTGNGRRESYAHLPMPRMTNTFMLAGESDPEDIVKSVNFGVYAKSFGGGQVEIASGRFVFSAVEAYLIEDGKLTTPIKGATLIGNGPDVMSKISMVGNDLELDTGIGTCGKEGQSVPVGVGQPTLKVDEIVVGGTSA